MERCDGCGYTYHDLAREILGEALVEATRGLVGSLTAADRMRDRPAPEVWSALEYGCHARDVLDVQRQRIGQVLVEETPALEQMRREERVTEMAYNEQDPAQVASDLEANAQALVGALNDLEGDDWERTAIYNWPEPAERTVDWIVRHTVHELVHHRQDIEKVGRGETP